MGSLTVIEATDSQLRIQLESLFVALPTIVGVATNDELSRVSRAISDHQRRVVNDVIRLLALRAVRAAKLHTSVVRTELVLVLARVVSVDNAAKFTDAAAYLRVVAHHRR